MSRLRLATPEGLVSLPPPFLPLSLPLSLLLALSPEEG